MYKNMIFADYHAHSTHSPDGNNTMEEMCQSAIDKGLQELCITDHFELYTPSVMTSEFKQANWTSLEEVQAYQVNFLYCKEKYKSKLTLKAGIEIGQPHVNLPRATQALSLFEFDYVLASMHEIDNQNLFWVDYLQSDLDVLQHRNLTEISQMIDKSDFDCVGHLDLIRRYGVGNALDLSISTYPTQLESVLEKVIFRGKGLEINTAGLYGLLNEVIPNIEILKLYRKLGGEIITFGSDAHNKDDLGKGIKQAWAIAKEAGFTKAALYTKRTPSFYEIP